MIVTVPDADGWHFASDGLPSGTVMGASMDEGGNLWVAGGNAGVFVRESGRVWFRGILGRERLDRLPRRARGDRMMPDGSMLQYAGAALGANAGARSGTSRSTARARSGG